METSLRPIFIDYIKFFGILTIVLDRETSIMAGGKRRRMNCQGGNFRDISPEKHIINRFRYIVERLRGRTGEALIIGSGDASLEKMLRQSGSMLKITSLDINEAFQDDMTAYADTVIIDDFVSHVFDKQYDILISVDVIEHVVDTDSFLKKAGDLLKPGGDFFLQTPNLASWHGRLSLLLGFTPEAMEHSMVKSYFGKFWIFRHENSIHHVRVFTYKGIQEFVKYYGFTIREAVGVDYRIPALFRHLPSIAGSVCLHLTK